MDPGARVGAERPRRCLEGHCCDCLDDGTRDTLCPQRAEGIRESWGVGLGGVRGRVLEMKPALSVSVGEGIRKGAGAGGTWWQLRIEFLPPEVVASRNPWYLCL